jgi:hypothetical protein
MAITIFVNGVAISYPQTGDPEWGDDATDFAIQTAAAFLKLGLSTGTSVDIPSTLDVTGATKLDSTLEVDGATQLDGSLTVAGNVTLNGNTNIGNETSDTTVVTGVLNVDSGTLYVNPTDNRVGVNTATPTVALDVVGSAAISGTLTAGTFAPTDLTVDTNLIITNSTDNRVGINTTSPTEALDVTGNIKQSGVLFNSDGTVSSPSITFTNDTNTGLYRIGADEIGVTTNGVQRTKIGSYGVYTSGSIVQVISTTKTDTFSTPSTSFTDITGLSLSITPKFATSKILIITMINSSTTNGGTFALLRDSTVVGSGTAAGTRSTGISAYNLGGSSQFGSGGSIVFLDEPNTTSATTYKIQTKAIAGTAYINRATDDTDTPSRARLSSTITLMEVAA